MSRESLVDQLESLSPLSPPSCFVLVWTYLIPARLSEAEQHLDQLGIHSNLLRKHIADSPDHRSVDEVLDALCQRQSDPQGFDRLLLEWFIVLDRSLAKIPVDNLLFEGFDGRDYRIRPTHPFIADYLEERLPPVTGAPHQGICLAAFARHHAVVAREHLSGYEVHARSVKSWAGRRLARRLRQVKNHGDFRVMLWPFKNPPVYTDLDLKNPKPYFCLDRIDNEDEMSEGVREALESALEKKATILIFPELAISPVVEEVIRKTLHGHGGRGYPLLTLFGRCHRPSGDGDLDLNEAVLLGPDGTDLGLHRKLAPYQHRIVREEETVETKEGLLRGKRITVFESPIGNLVPLICLDFFQQAASDILGDIHGNLFLVSSLSGKTTTHADQARRLQARLGASSFVCNGWLTHRWVKGRWVTARDAVAEAGASFFRIPCKDGYVTHFGDHPDSPYLLCSLQAERDRQTEFVLQVKFK